jgi:uncharacterized RmlC-like cupin family protein
MYYGEKLENHMVTGACDFVYIPANTPHLPYKMSQTEPATAVFSRTDPNEQERIVFAQAVRDSHVGRVIGGLAAPI